MLVEGEGGPCCCRENSLFASIYSLLQVVGNFTANPLRTLASSVNHWPDFVRIPCIFPMIREFDRRDSFAVASEHSHLVARLSPLPGLRQAVRKQGGNPPPNDSVRAGLDSRETVSVRACGISQPLSLQGILRGHTRDLADARVMSSNPMLSANHSRAFWLSPGLPQS